ncbi:major facilitator superfamily domain-containing protein [Spinellus fusiger]|nr:major facilitator superfamily domain-containing protein [Spinellus fusiger]
MLSSSLFTGMMVGAFFWGSYSDSKGRKLPYTMTLAITSFFGIFSCAAFSFWSLCLMMFFVGLGVGGNMPTDGALYLEFLPREQHYLLTFMSVFFSMGAVLSSIFGYLILPSTSCPEPTLETPHPSCDVATENNGWRWVFFSVGITTLFMLCIRTFCFQLPETPKFLMSQDRKNETIIVLKNIARMNGGDLTISHQDLPNHPRTQNPLSATSEEEESFLDHSDHSETTSLVLESHSSLDSHWRQLLTPQWRKTTLLIVAIWTLTAMAYTMFNVFLPKYLESSEEGGKISIRKDVYWDYMVYSVAGVPGSVIASYMIETWLGRKGTMALSAFGSAVALFIFSVINSRLTMLISSSMVSFLATLLYAVIYGYTPEVFDTNIRGTAVGTAAGIGRVAGIISPVVCGMMFSINNSIPLYTSVLGFTLVGVCILLLPIETRTCKS